MLERPFAHCYETGGMRRVHLRGRENILKRLLVHVAGFNLSLVLRLMLGKGTPRGLQDLATQYFFCSGPNKGFRALFAGSALSAPLGISGIRVGLFHALDYSNAGCVLVDPDTKIPTGPWSPRTVPCTSQASLLVLTARNGDCAFTRSCPN